MSAPPQSARAWLDDFFASYYRRRPVNATFIGVHDYDDRLPDYSDAGVAETVAEMGTLAARLHDGSVVPPTNEAEAIDLRLAEHFLTVQRWEFASRHFQRGNPCVYTGEAIFGILSLFIRPFAPLEQRVAAAIARMDAIPAFLSQAQRNVLSAPPEWTGRAIRECIGAVHFLDGGVEILMADEGIANPRFRDAATLASVAFGEYQSFLEKAVRANPTDAYACGEEAFEMYLRLGHELNATGSEVEWYARAAYAEALAALEAGAGAFGVSDWRDALAQLADDHPTSERYYGRYQTLWDACYATATAHDLVTWPDFPIRFVPQPRWAREAAPYLYFLFYRSPSPFDHIPANDYLVTPIEPEMPADEQERRLRVTNESVIKLNHVIHHGGIGHHVQNWCSFRAESRIGRIAAVDCASRIAMFCGGTLAEGWSSYVVDLMSEVGFLTPLEKYSQHHARMRAAARAIVDVSLHCGRFSFDEAVVFYRDETGMSADAARAEAIKNSMFPAAAMMYLVGQDMIRDLRRDIAAREGSAFSLRRFHDRFLSYGSIPVSLIAAAMRADVAV